MFLKLELACYDYIQIHDYLSLVCLSFQTIKIYLFIKTCLKVVLKQSKIIFAMFRITLKDDLNQKQIMFLKLNLLGTTIYKF